MPDFFVPRVDTNEQEDAYKQLADFVGVASLDPARRIYSMTWKHDGVEWTAVVGEELRGTETKKIGKGRKATYREVPRGTNDTVLAVFSGVPHRIVHDNKSGYWNMPIYAGEPSRVEYFE